MGTGASYDSKENSIDDIMNEINLLTHQLPIAELLNGGLIRLTGLSGFFNPDSLLEPSWLKGKMTAGEYRSAINSINRATANALVGRSRYTMKHDMPELERLKIEAGTTAFNEINRQYGSIRFTYQKSVEAMQFIATWNSSLTSRAALLGQCGLASGPKYFIYININ